MGKSFKVVKYRLPLERNKYKIFESKNSNFKYNNIDLAIVPVIGVDKTMRRVGFGAGMYDRYFNNCKKKPYIIFIQLKKMISKEIITHSYDVKCDLYIGGK